MQMIKEKRPRMIHTYNKKIPFENVLFNFNKEIQFHKSVNKYNEESKCLIILIYFAVRATPVFIVHY